MATRLCRSEKYRRRPRDVRRCLVHAANNRGREGEGSDAAARKGTGNADAVIGALFLCHKATNSRVMSALCQKQTFCAAAKTGAIRSLRRRGRAGLGECRV